MNCKKTWTSKRLLEVIDFNPKETLRKGQRAKKIAMEQLRPFSKTPMGYCEEFYNGGAKFKNGDTLLARITPCLENGKTAQVNELEEGEVGFGSTEYIVLRAKEGKSDKDFIYYLSISPNFRSIAIKSMVGSSGRQRVQQNVLENVEFLLPDLKTQKKISAVLGSLDNKIELNEKINQNLEAQAQAIFKSWFVDFEPFKNGKFVDSELGKIPEGWTVNTLSNIVYLKKGKKPKELSEIKHENYIPYLTIDALSGGRPLFCDTEKMLLAKEKDILLVMDGASSGAIFYGLDGVVASTIIKLELTNTEIREIVFAFLNYKQLDLKSHTTGSAIPHLDKDRLLSYKIALPSNGKLLRKISGTLTSLRDNIIRNRKESRRLAQLRDTLLPKLMSGEIDISDVAV